MTLLGSGYCLTSTFSWPAYLRTYWSYQRTLEQCQEACMSLTECTAIRHYSNTRCMLYCPAASSRPSIAGSWSWVGPRLSNNGPITETWGSSGNCYVKPSSGSFHSHKNLYSIKIYAGSTFQLKKLFRTWLF